LRSSEYPSQTEDLVRKLIPSDSGTFGASKSLFWKIKGPVKRAVALLRRHPLE
jgi:hypothetical protein